MAQIRAEAGEQDVLVGNGDTVFGTSTIGETYRVGARSGLVTFQGGFLEGGDIIFLEGPASSWTAQSGGGGSFILLSRGDLQVRIPVPEADSPTTLIFADDILFGSTDEGESRELYYDNAQNSIVVGDQAVGGTAEDLEGGADVLGFDADTMIDASSTVINGASEISLGTRRDEDAIDGHTYNIVLDDDNLPDLSNILKIDGSALAGDSDSDGPLIAEVISIDASRVTLFGLDLTAGAAADTIFLSQAVDRIDAGGGRDFIWAGANLTSQDVVDGGEDSAAMVLSGNYNDTAFAQVTNVSILLLNTPSTLVLGSNAAAAGVDGVGDGSDGASVVDASGYTSATGIFVYDGGAGADVVALGNATNSLSYSLATDSSEATGQDTVYNFLSGVDKINVRSLDTPGFHSEISFRGNHSGEIASEAALDPFDTDLDVVFDTSTSTLWVDVDDDGQLEDTDLSIYLPGVGSLQPEDVYDGSFHFG